eukprot:TRINITY_DN1002_c0_g1_i1.p1 TRINITY_DN1002_c0_g1~~TRINITY_DN1002_c0_g1_i1.p1  ORF type:complete len:209 (-),score=37.84 TRINITY_DN1002_c0_g1_i1:49-675(-)
MRIHTAGRQGHLFRRLSGYATLIYFTPRKQMFLRRSSSILRYAGLARSIKPTPPEQRPQQYNNNERVHLNRVILIGTVGKDPEIRQFEESGSKMASFPMVTNENIYSKKAGGFIQASEWHNITATNNSVAEYIERSVRKGALCLVEGSIQTQTYTSADGVTKTNKKIKLGSQGIVKVLSRPKKEQPDQNNSNNNNNNKTPQDEEEFVI